MEAIYYLNCVSCNKELKESIKEYLGCFYCDECYKKKKWSTRVNCAMCDNIIARNDIIYTYGKFYCSICYEIGRKNPRREASPPYCKSCTTTGVDLIKGTALVAGDSGYYCKRCFSFETREGMRKKKTTLYTIYCTRCRKAMGKSTVTGLSTFYCYDCYSGKTEPKEKMSLWELRVKQIEIE